MRPLDGIIAYFVTNRSYCTHSPNRIVFIHVSHFSFYSKHQIVAQLDKSIKNKYSKLLLHLNWSINLSCPINIIILSINGVLRKSKNNISGRNASVIRHSDMGNQILHKVPMTLANPAWL